MEVGGGRSCQWLRGRPTACAMFPLVRLLTVIPAEAGRRYGQERLAEWRHEQARLLLEAAQATNAWPARLGRSVGLPNRGSVS